MELSMMELVSRDFSGYRILLNGSSALKLPSFVVYRRFTNIVFFFVLFYGDFCYVFIFDY